jgi:hypothetical protein
MHGLRVSALSLVTMAVVVLGLAGTAGARSMSVTAAIKAQDRAVKHSTALKKLSRLNASTPAQAKKVIPDLQALEKKLDQAATAVSKATASTPRQKAGQKDWVGGVRGLAHGFAQLVIALKDVEHGNKTAARAEAVTAQKTLDKANSLGEKGDRLLGLPTSD